MAIKDILKEHIADQTYRLLTRKSLTKLTMKEIAEACEVSKPTLYHYFADKYAIAQYLCKRFNDHFYAQYSYADTIFRKDCETAFYTFDHPEFFRNVLCYDGQNSIFDYMAQLELEECLRQVRKATGRQEVSEDVMAAAEHYAYTVMHAEYAILLGKIPNRYASLTRPAGTIYLPEPLLEIFRSYARGKGKDPEGKTKQEEELPRPVF